MATQLAVVQHQSPAAQSFTMGEMERIATAIAKGRLFGSDDPNAVLTLCMLAQAEGKHPALIMQNYHIIQGKPAKKAEAMLVDFLASGGRVEWHELTDDIADATFSHPQGGTVRISWDSARVAAAGLGSNPMHKKFPRQMKRSRTISEGVKTVFPGATSGLYTPEEVSDFEPAPRNATPPAPPAQRARQIEAKPQPKHDATTGEIAADEVPELAPEADDPRLATLYRIKAALNAATSTAALESISADNLAHYEAMTVEQQAEITEAYQGRWAELEA